MQKNDPLHLLLAMRKAYRHLWQCLNMMEKGAHVRICKAKRRHEPVAVLVPYEWYVLATGFRVVPDGNGTKLFRFSKEFCDFAMTRRAALGITPDESRNYLIRHDLADPGEFQGGPADLGSGLGRG